MRRAHQGSNTQACYVLAIAFDLLDETRVKQAAAHLVADIEQRDGHLSTGFIGTKDLMLALARIGRNDVAYRLLHNDTFPSWGFSIRHGASSIWERWDGWTPEKGFQDPWHELLRPLLLRRGLPVDGGEHRRHPQRRAGLPAHRHRAAAGRQADHRPHQLPQRARADRDRVDARRATGWTCA
jgi:hypothetical protein